MKEDREVVLLDDSPATSDAFGPHQRIADAVRKLVTTEPGGRAIALIGTWGGGKSTVVNLLRNGADGAKKEKDGNLEILVFDAWCHEGDPLRRTYLEKFINFLLERKWVSREKWKKRLGELSGRYKETSTSSTPQLTWLGAVCSLLLFLVAVGLAILSGGTVETQLWWWARLGLWLTFCPIGLIMLAWVGASLWERATGSPRGASADVLGYFVNKQKETTKTETVEAPEPTSVEFQMWFRELAEEALVGDRRLLMAVDNLDRVDAGDALKLWSALRTFVDFSEAERPSWAEKLWVLAAFDENGVKRLWENAAGDSPASTFLDKTFQIRFQIPAPLLSDWRGFLMDQLRKAFPLGADEEFHRVSRIFAVLKAEKAPPTPRDIKVFVNQIGAVYRTSAEPYSLAHYALYVALLDRGWTLDTKEIPERVHLEPYLDRDWEEALVSLHYIMPRKEAMHIRLQAEVERALTDGNAESLKNLADKRGIEFVVEATIENRLPDWAAKEPHIIGRAAYALGGLKTSTAWQVGAAFRRLACEARTITDWKTFDAASGKGLSLLVEREKDLEFCRAIVHSLSKSPFSAGDLSSGEVGELDWLKGLSQVIQGLVRLGHLGVLEDAFTITQDAGGYIYAMASAAAFDTARESWKYFRPGCDPRLIIERMGQVVHAGQFNLWHDGAVGVMLVVKCEWPWESLGQQFGALQSVQELPAKQAGPWVRTLLRIRNHTKAASDQLRSLAETGWIYCHLGTCLAATNDEAVASLLLCILMNDPETTSQANPARNFQYDQRFAQLNQRWSQGRTGYSSIASNPGQHAPIVEELTRQTRALGCVQDILACRQSSNVARPIADEILRGLAKSLDSEESFPVEDVQKLYPVLRVALDSGTLESLLKNLVERRGLEEQLARSSVTVETSGLYRSVLHIKRTAALTDAAANGLRLLTQEDWKRTFAEVNDLFGLIKDLITWEATLGLGYQLQDALMAFLDSSLTQPIPKHVTAEACSALFGAMETEQKEVFKRNLRDKVIGANASVKNMLLLFGPILGDCGLLESKADDLVRTGFSKILDRRDAEEYTWVRDVLARCPRIYERCPKDARHYFEQKIQGLDRTGLTADCNKIFEEIAKLCRVKLRGNGGTHDEKPSS